MKFIQSDFKTIQISLYMIDYDDVKKRAYRFLLPKLLTSHTEKLNTRIDMSKHLQDLYGALLGGRTYYLANLNVINIACQIVNPQIVNESTLLKDTIDLFLDMLDRKTLFNEKIFNEEKRMLIEQWDSIKDQKRLYANTKFNESFYGKHPFGYPQSGYKSDIEAITLEDMYDYFKDVISSNTISIYINGYTSDLETLKKLEVFEQNINHKIKFSQILFNEPKDVIETIDMKQSMIKIGYELPIFRNDSLYEAAIMLDLMIGGYVESLMFKIIREEMGLCYDVRSSYDATQGVMIISSGVDQKRTDEAIFHMKKMIESPLDYEFNEEKLELAKQFVTHQIKSSYDDQGAMTSRSFYDDLYGTNLTMEEKIQKYLNVSFEDVLLAHKKLKLNTVYVLTGDNHDH
ncbi:MAG: M16 family metallopeptidase [Acholeplasmataceae bacterium]